MDNNELTKEDFNTKQSGIVNDKVGEIVGQVDDDQFQEKTIKKIKKLQTGIIEDVKQTTRSATKTKKYFMDQQPQNVPNFEDPIFPANRSGLLGLDNYFIQIDQNECRRKQAELDFKIDDKDVIWLRPKEIFGEYTLFKNGTDVIKQKLIGNCNFKNSISILIETYNNISEIFRIQDVNPNGYYEICLKLDGEWQVVIIDDFIPCNKETKTPLFTIPVDNQIWSLLLEKAWAKVNRGYINIISGNVSEVIKSVTNFPCYCNIIENLESEELWSKITDASKNKYIMITSVHPDKAINVGLEKEQIYLLISCKEYNGIRLLRIRNPFNSVKYNGIWNYADSKWDNDLKKAFEYSNTYNKNTDFFISWDEFKNIFLDVDICEINNKIYMKKMQVKSAEWNNGPRCYQLVLLEKSNVSITIFKPCYRFLKTLPTEWTVSQQLFLARCEDHNLQTYCDYLGTADGQNDCTISKVLLPGTYYLYAYVNYSSALDLDGNPISNEVIDTLQNNLNIYSSEFFDLEFIDEPLMGTFCAIVKDYCRKSELKKQNNLLTYVAQNFLNSEFYFLYIKSEIIKQVEFLITFDNVNLTKITHILNPLSFVLFPEQEQIIIFGVNNIFESHRLKYSYTYKDTEESTPEELIPLFQTSFPLPNQFQNYDWVYEDKKEPKKGSLKKIIEPEIVLQQNQFKTNNKNQTFKEERTEVDEVADELNLKINTNNDKYTIKINNENHNHTIDTDKNEKNEIKKTIETRKTDKNGNNDVTAIEINKNENNKFTTKETNKNENKNIITIEMNNNENVKQIDRNETVININENVENSNDNVQYGSCTYNTYKVFESIIYPFLSFIITLLIEIVIGAFILAFGAVFLVVIIGMYGFMLLKLMCVLCCGNAQESNINNNCSFIHEKLFWSFKKLFWGIIMIIWTIFDSIIAIVSTIKAICNGDISPNKTLYDNLSTMWSFCCLFAKSHDLLKIDFPTKPNENNDG